MNEMRRRELAEAVSTMIGEYGFNTNKNIDIDLEF